MVKRLSSTVMLSFFMSPIFLFAQEISILKFKLSNTEYNDEIAIRFFEQATNELDTQWDAIKLYSLEEDVPGLSFSWNGIEYAVNSLPKLESNVIVPLKIKAGVTDIYKIEMEELFPLPKNVCLKIEDLENGELIPFDTENPYELTLIKGYNDIRLKLHFVFSKKSPIKELNCNSQSTDIIAEGDGAGPWVFTWHSSSGTILKQIQKNHKTDTLSNVTKGTYLIQIEDEKGVCKKLLDTINVVANESSIKITDYTIINTCEEENNGAIALEIESSDSISYEWSNNMTTKNIEGLKTGEYTVTITDKKNCISTRQFIVGENQKLNFTLENETYNFPIESEIYFINQSNLSQNFTWDFGDGTSSEDVNPTHTYSYPGEYEVSLSSSTNCATFTQTIYVNNSLKIKKENLENQFVIYSNNSQIIVESTSDLSNTTQVYINDINGRLISKTSSSERKIQFNIEQFFNGVYILNIITNKGIFTKKIIHNI